MSWATTTQTHPQLLSKMEASNKNNQKVKVTQNYSLSSTWHKKKSGSQQEGEQVFITPPKKKENGQNPDSGSKNSGNQNNDALL